MKKKPSLVIGHQFTSGMERGLPDERIGRLPSPQLAHGARRARPDRRPAATLLWQSARGTIVPRMVQVDRLGEAQAGAPAIANFRPTDPQIGGTACRKGDSEANRPGWSKRLPQGRRGEQCASQTQGTTARCS